jgi:hypothetical protein
LSSFGGAQRRPEDHTTPAPLRVAADPPVDAFGIAEG